MPPAHRCPYCHSSRPTHAAVNRHISQRSACHQKWRESLSISISVTREESEEPEPEAAPDSEDPETLTRAVSPAFFSHDPLEDEDEDETFGPPPRAASPDPEPEDRAPSPNFSRFIEPFPGEEKFPRHETFIEASAGTVGRGETLFERMQAEQAAAELGPYAPFVDGEEWDLASWLSKNVSQTATDAYLKLPITQRHTKVSYHNNHAYMQKVDQLPTGPGWKCEIVTVAGNQLDENDEMMKEDLELWKR
ncbi:hypothetical protein DFH07DRAFT_763598 [Mycena maculata]|uniref:Uncharacterized protein n=1 Tax=Mycena maculata TaxID=230809 RepID=A0AAD7P2H8_9AGAR|nr:hypothetical protein DFH07DRAFT_763598 [Mycena maculata]